MPPNKIERRVVNSFLRSFTSLEKYLRSVLRGLHRENGLIATDAFNITKIENTIRTLELQLQSRGYKGAMAQQLDGLRELSGEVMETSRLLAEESDELPAFNEFARASGHAIDSMIEGAERELLQASSKTSVEVGELLRRSILGGVDYVDLLESIENKIGSNRSQTLTLTRSTLHSFNSQLRTTQAREIGVEWFLYQGPRDDLARAWCSHWVGMRGTEQSFNATGKKWGRDKQPYPISAWRGGWNCRHAFVPLIGASIERHPIGPRYPEIYDVPGKMIRPRQENIAQKKGLKLKLEDEGKKPKDKPKPTGKPSDKKEIKVDRKIRNAEIDRLRKETAKIKRNTAAMRRKASSIEKDAEKIAKKRARIKRKKWLIQDKQELERELESLNKDMDALKAKIDEAK